MFNEVKITINEGVGLARLINDVIKGFDIMPFQLNHRLNRQLTKLSVAEKEMGEAKTAVLKQLIGEEKFQKAAEKDLPLAKALTKSQQAEFEDLFHKELQSEITVGLLSQTFEDIIGNPEIDTEIANKISAVLEFLDKKVWSKE